MTSGIASTIARTSSKVTDRRCAPFFLAMLVRFVAATAHSRCDAHDTAKAEVTCRRVDPLRHPRGRPITSAVVRRAEVRPTLHDPARDLHAGRARVDARVALAAARIC